MIVLLRSHNTGATAKMEKAFFELLESTHYSKISVTELIKRAGVSRTTFYRHYTDILDMYNKISFHIVDVFTEELLKILYRDDNFGQESDIDKFMEKMYSQMPYLGLLCGENGSRNIFLVIFDIIDTYISTSVKNVEEEEVFAFRFLICAGIGTFVKSIMMNERLDNEFLMMCRDVLIMARGDGDKKCREK